METDCGYFETSEEETATGGGDGAEEQGSCGGDEVKIMPIMKIKFIYIVCVIVFVIGVNRNAECSTGNTFWWSVFGGWGYWLSEDLDGYDSDDYYIDFYCTMGIQMYRFDVSVNINPLALIIALDTRMDVGIRIYETNSLMIRLFTGFGDINLNERRGLYNDFIVIGCDVGFYKMNFESCCLSLTRDESWIFVSFYLQRLWGSNNRAYDSLVAGIGCRW